MGIVGYGRIGRRTGRIAQALGMKVLAYDTSKDASLENDSMRYTGLEELFQSSDVIVLHCPLFPSTKGMICKETIGKMKDGVIIINNSRGPLVVEQDLADALNDGKVAGAAVDVVTEEPMRADCPLLSAQNCIITPHISWASKESRQRLMELALSNLKAFLDGSPINIVNR